MRDRIFDTACDLFYRHGIRAVGVDAIANEAGTNKMSFYRSFASKEELVAEYLKDKVREYWVWWDETIAPSLAMRAARPRRCSAPTWTWPRPSTSRFRLQNQPRLRTRQRLGGDPRRQRRCSAPSCTHYKAEIRRRLRKLAREMGAREPDALGDGLMLLMEGGYYTRLTFPCNSGPVAAIVKAARTLIDAHVGR